MSETTYPEAGFANRTLADIAATLPGSTGVFRRHKLDFCCGGRVKLAQAAADRGLELDGLEAELAAVVTLGLPAERPESTEDLITLSRPATTQRIGANCRSSCDWRGGWRPCTRTSQQSRVALAALLERMGSELEDHMRKEEDVLFPLMRRGGHPMIAQPIAVMLAEHDDHGAHLRTLERLTDDFTAPAEACPTWRALYIGVKKLADDLVEHIHTENNVLFPRFLEVRAPAQ